MSAAHRRHLHRLAGALLLLACGDALAASFESMTVGQARGAALSKALILVDIRTPGEWRESGVADVAVPLDMTQKGFIEKLLALRRDDRSARLGLICATGGRSRYLATWLVRQGVSGIVDVPAGMHTRDGWLARKLPVRPPEAASGPPTSAPPAGKDGVTR